MSLRLIVAEDAVLLREGLVGLLERVGHQVVAPSATPTLWWRRSARTGPT